MTALELCADVLLRTDDKYSMECYRKDAEKLAHMLKLAIGFIHAKLVCLGERHDCPSCNGIDAEETLEEIDRIANETT